MLSPDDGQIMSQRSIDDGGAHAARRRRGPALGARLTGLAADDMVRP
jgi:hypothetical protein